MDDAFDHFMHRFLLRGAFDHNGIRSVSAFIGAFACDNGHRGWTVGGGMEMTIVPGFSH